MNNFLVLQLDYIFFFYGVSFLALGIICFFLNKASQDVIPWNWLGLFGLTHGINELLDLLALYWNPRALEYTRFIVLALSFVALLLFGLIGLSRLQQKRRVFWIWMIPLLLLLVSLSAGFEKAKVLVRYALGFPGCAISAYYLARYALKEVSNKIKKIPLFLLVLCFCIYAILTGIIVPHQNLLLAQWLHYDWFIQVFGVPVQLLRGIMALLIAIFVGCYSFLISLYLDKKSNIGLFRRMILLLLGTIISLCTVFGLGFFVVNNLTRPALINVRDIGQSELSLLNLHLVERFEVVQHITVLLSESPDIISQLGSEKEKSTEYMRLLDRQSRILPDTTCYLLDVNGTCLDSSNRNSKDSFVGKSYAFRTYFKEAMQGGLSTYFAYGVTSKKRGFYAATPVKDGSGAVKGVVVVKKDIDEDVTHFREFNFSFFINENGIIFLSSKPEYIFKSMWPIEKNIQKQITDSRQFGELSFSPLLPRQITSGQWIKLGNSFYYVDMSPVNIAGWSVAFFTSGNSIIMYRLFGIAIVFSIVILIIMFYLVSIKREEYLLSQKQSRNQLNQTYDILKTTQAQLVQSAKMASVGQLAGGVAHEINNPLTGVLNNAQLIKIIADKNSGQINYQQFKDLLDIIEESALRCKKITQSLLDFFHTSKGASAPVSLNDIAEKVVVLIEHEMKLENITIHKQFQPDLPSVLGDSQLLQQVIMDILVNARWAIKKRPERGSGSITIQTRYDLENKQVHIDIADTGIGIPKENLDKIFEPFFTTKPVGEGTGLGLSVVYNIIKAHNGSIVVDSEVGKSTTFKICLPIV